MSTFTITLHDGMQLSNITQNGSMFVSLSEITDAMLSKEALKTVIIAEVTDGQITTTTINNAVCDGILHWPEGWLFNLREPSTEDELHAQIEALNTDLTNTQLALVEVYELIGG